MTKSPSLLLAFAIAALWAGCHKDVGMTPTSENSIAVTIRNTDTYTYKTGITGDEDGAIIKTQALHYEKSAIIRDASTRWEAVYVYKPQVGYAGSDHVEIQLSAGSDGASPPTRIEVVKINFTVEHF